MEHKIDFSIVDMAVSKENRRKRNLLNIILFISFIGLSSIFVFVFQSKLIPLLLMIPFGIASYFVSKRSRKLHKIGNISMIEQTILLLNEITKANRKIDTSDVSKIFIRGGVDIHSDYLNRKSLFLDITLKTEEVVIVHIEVTELDELTADLITNYCQVFHIPCDRKL